MAPLPIKFTEQLQLSSIGVTSEAIGFNSCVRCRPRRVAATVFVRLLTPRANRH